MISTQLGRALPCKSSVGALPLRLGLKVVCIPRRMSSTTATNGDSKSSITNWASKDGEFRRQPSQFRSWVENKPDAEFPAEKDRYHLYVSYACPWAHRTLIVRKLKGLEDIIPFTSVHWHMLEKGWPFATTQDIADEANNVTRDPLHPEFTHLRELYFEQNNEYNGRFTIPILYDKKQRKIVSNESAEIIRMFYTAFDDLIDEKYRNVNLFPKDLQSQIEDTNSWTYEYVNNGVYRSGFATAQDAYEKAVTALFKHLDKIEEHLTKIASPYYFGNNITEADVRLYTTIVRFDPVYVQHFKCNIRDIRSGYPAIHKWLKALYWNHPAFKDTTNFDHIKFHYTKSHKQINPHSITPLGPEPNILPLDEEVPAAKAVQGKL